MTHQYLSNVYCVQGMMLLGKKGSFSFFFFFFLDYKGKSSTPFSERVFSCRVCGPAVRACCGAATMEAGAQGTVARSFGGDTQLWIATRLRKEQH